MVDVLDAKEVQISEAPSETSTPKSNPRAEAEAIVVNAMADARARKAQQLLEEAKPGQSATNSGVDGQVTPHNPPMFDRIDRPTYTNFARRTRSDVLPTVRRQGDEAATGTVAVSESQQTQELAQPTQTAQETTSQAPSKADVMNNPKTAADWDTFGRYSDPAEKARMDEVMEGLPSEIKQRLGEGLWRAYEPDNMLSTDSRESYGLSAPKRPALVRPRPTYKGDAISPIVVGDKSSAAINREMNPATLAAGEPLLIDSVVQRMLDERKKNANIRYEGKPFHDFAPRAFDASRVASNGTSSGAERPQVRSVDSRDSSRLSSVGTKVSEYVTEGGNSRGELASGRSGASASEGGMAGGGSSSESSTVSSSEHAGTPSERRTEDVRKRAEEKSERTWRKRILLIGAGLGIGATFFGGHNAGEADRYQPSTGPSTNTVTETMDSAMPSQDLQAVGIDIAGSITQPVVEDSKPTPTSTSETDLHQAQRDEGMNKEASQSTVSTIDSSASETTAHTTRRTEESTKEAEQSSESAPTSESDVVITSNENDGLHQDGTSITAEGASPSDPDKVSLTPDNPPETVEQSPEMRSFTAVAGDTMGEQIFGLNGDSEAGKQAIKTKLNDPANFSLIAKTAELNAGKPGMPSKEDIDRMIDNVNAGTMTQEAFWNATLNNINVGETYFIATASPTSEGLVGGSAVTGETSNAATSMVGGTTTQEARLVSDTSIQEESRASSSGKQNIISRAFSAFRSRRGKPTQS